MSRLRRTLWTGGGLLMGLTPRVASACIWNWQHRFMPLPPCTTADAPKKGRIDQLNVKLVGNLALLASKIREVQTEVYQWQRASTVAGQWDRQLKSTYGDLTTSPMPAMVAAYNRTALGSYVRLTGNNFDFSLEPRDLRATLDSVRDRIAETTSDQYRDLMSTGRSDWAAVRGTPFQLGHQINGQVQAMTDWRRESQVIRDSVLAAGQRNAARYAQTTTASGTSEAELSLFNGRLSLLRGTSLELQARALEARMRALEAAQSTNSDLVPIRLRTNPALYRP